MPEILDHVEYLSQQVGPRPAGTEEEQQAALYITEQLQKEAGLPAVIEDFNSPSNSELPRAICAAVTLAAAVLSLALPVLLIPAFVLTLISALVIAAEAFGRPVISPFFARGVSQNVVAKYEPGYSNDGGSRRRKIILVARYDSGKVRVELNGPMLGIMPVLNWVGFGGAVAVPVLLLVKALFLLNATGAAAVVLMVLTVIAAVCAAVPGALAVLHKLAAYNEGANSNAAGVAVLMDVARRIGRGRVSEEELAARGQDVTVHGEDAAVAAGLVPEGAQLVYEAAAIASPEPAPQTQEERLTAAKAAIAAMTGKPVNMNTSLDLSENLVQVKEEPLPSNPSESELIAQRDEVRQAFASIPADTIQTALENAAGGTQSAEAVAAAAAGAVVADASAAASAGVAAVAEEPRESSVPAWFKKAQAKAKKPKAAQSVQIHRSRYAEALDAISLEQMAPEPEQPMPAPAPVSTASVAASQVVDEGVTAQMAPVTCMPEAASATTGVTGIAEPVVSAVQEASTSTCDQSPSSSETFVSTVPASEPALPSFLDAAKVQSEAASHQPVKSENRMEVAFDPEVAGFQKTGASMPMPAVPALADLPVVPSLQGVEGNQPVALPGNPAVDLVPVEELQKQRAPLAEAAKGNRRALGKSLRSMLPSITGSITAESVAAAQVAQETESPTLSRASIPSLSGAISPIGTPAVDAAAVEDGQETQFMAPVAGTAGMTGAFAPVSSELLQNVDSDDIYVDDADDSVYEESFTETGAFAGPGYVDMPKSRMSRLLGRFRRKKNDEAESAASEWLGVDEDFDARSAGAARGGWESFRSEDVEEYDDSYEIAQYDDASWDDESVYEESRGEASDDGFVDIDFDSFDGAGQGFPSDTRRRWNGGAFSLGRERADRGAGAAELPAAPVEEYQQIYQFRNPDINTEVWFVALGSELAGNAGMQAFLKEHERDLSGSIIVELDSLGAGDLCLIEREGAYRKVKTSSRMKRIVKKATQATGTSVASTSILWSDSSASYATAHGVQAMHLAGMDGIKPVFFAQGNDVLENVDASLLEERVEYVLALLKSI